MNSASRRFPAGSLRVSDAERDRALAELSEHYQAGRLSTEEFDDRTGRALRAKTGQELSSVFADLPDDPTPWIDPSVGTGWAGRPVPDLVSQRNLAWPADRVTLPVLRIVLTCAIVAILLGWLSFGHRAGHGAVGLIVPLLFVLLIVRRFTKGKR